MALQRNTHHVYRLMYHFVWIPKYRHKVFCEPYREALKGIIGKAAYDYNIDIVELEIPEDHIHMIVLVTMAQSSVNGLWRVRVSRTNRSGMLRMIFQVENW